MQNMEKRLSVRFTALLKPQNSEEGGCSGGDDRRLIADG